MKDSIAKKVLNANLERFYRWAKRALGDSPGMSIAAHEVDSLYMGQLDPEKNVRFVVSLIAGYDPEVEKLIQTPGEAAAATLDLIRDPRAAGVQWCVFDRAEGKMHRLTQGTFDQELSWESQAMKIEQEAAQRALEKAAIEALVNVALAIVEEMPDLQEHPAMQSRAFRAATAVLEGIGYAAFDAAVAEELTSRKISDLLKREERRQA